MSFELHRAVKDDNRELAEFLIKNGADVNEIKKENKSPLFYSITNNNFKMVKMLLDFDAKIELNGYSYLFLALQQSIILNIDATEKAHRNINYNIVKLLIDKGGNVDDFAVDGTNVLILSALFSHYYPLIELLLDKGANIQKYEFILEKSIENFNDSSEKTFWLETAKLIISYVLSEYQPKEKPDFVKKNRQFSNHWDDVLKKTNYLLENPVIGCKRSTQETLNKKLLHKTDSLQSLSLTQFFKSINAEKLNENMPSVASTSKLGKNFILQTLQRLFK